MSRFVCMGQNPAFICMMVMTTSFFFVEIIVGYMTNSMALVADSFHMLSDIISLFVGFFAMRYSKKTQGSVFDANTFGWARAEVLGALVNAVFLVALCFSILVEAFKRLVEPEGLTDPDLILIVGGIGLLVNLIGMLLFHGHGSAHGHSHGGGGHGHSHSHGHSHDKKNKDAIEIHDYPASTKGDITTTAALPSPRGTGEIENGVQNMSFDEGGDGSKDVRNREIVIAVDFQGTNSGHDDDHKHNSKKTKGPKTSGQMNMRGVYLHILGDALGSVIVIIAALVIKYFDGKWTLYVDPVMSIIMVAIILKTSIPLLKESSTILLQHVPSHIELSKLQERLMVTFPEIVAVHEFHVWQLTGSRIVASLHVMFSSPTHYNVLSPSMKEFFHKEGIHSTTVQPEYIEDDDEQKCLLACVDEACAEKVCCKPKKSTEAENGSLGSRNSSPRLIAKSVQAQEHDRKSNSSTTTATKEINSSCPGNVSDATTSSIKLDSTMTTFLDINLENNEDGDNSKTINDEDRQDRRLKADEGSDHRKIEIVIDDSATPITTPRSPHSTTSAELNDTNSQL